MLLKGATTTISRILAVLILGQLTSKANGLHYSGQEHPYFTTNGNSPRPWAPQFTSWYRKYGSTLSALSKDQCNATSRDYNIAFYAPKGSLEYSQLLSVCYQHEAWVYDGLTMDQQLNFQSATVMMGLMPTLMASIGVSVSEIALLSAYQSLLSLLISLAAPAIWPTRIFEYEDPSLLFDRRSGRLEIPQLGTWSACLLRLFQYAVSLGAAINISLASWEMGHKTILSWGCTTVFLPLLWSSLAAIPHIPAALSYRMVIWKYRWVSKNNNSKFWHRCKFASVTGPMMHAKQSPPTKHHLTNVPMVAVILSIIAGGLSFVHLFVGTIIFSSLVFVSVSSVLNQILWRFVDSTAAARIILMVELARLRAATRSIDMVNTIEAK